MPVYCYQCDDGEIVEVFMSDESRQTREDADGRIVLEDGRLAQRHYPSERPGISTDWGKPLLSQGLAVHPSQVGAFLKSAEHYREVTGVDPEPDFVMNAAGTSALMRLKSRKHRNKVLDWRGIGDCDAGYADRTPKVNQRREIAPPRSEERRS